MSRVGTKNTPECSTRPILKQHSGPRCSTFARRGPATFAWRRRKCAGPAPQRRRRRGPARVQNTIKTASSGGTCVCARARAVVVYWFDMTCTAGRVATCHESLAQSRTGAHRSARSPESRCPEVGADEQCGYDDLL